MRKIALGALLLFIAASFLPFGGNKFDIMSQANLLYMVGLLVAIFAAVLLQKQSYFRKTPLLIVFFALLLISLLTSQIHNYGWSETLIWGFAIIIFAVTQTFSEKEKKFLKIALTTFALISCAIGFAAYLMRPETRMAGLFFDLSDVRHVWPNAFALLLLMTWPVAADLTSGKKWWLRVLILTPIFTALFLTFSRAAMIAFALQLIIIFLFRVPRHKSQVTSFFAILLATILLITSLQYARNLQFNTNSFQKKIAFEGTEKQTSFQERLDFFKGGMKLAWEKPLFGFGPGTFRFVYPSVQPDFLANSDHPHNIFIKLGMENGIPASLALLVFFALFTWEFWKKRRTEDAQKKLLLFAAVLGALAHNLVDYNLNFLSNITIFWILIALVIPEEPAPLQPKSHTSQVTRHTFFVVLAIVLTLSVIAEAATSLAFRLTGSLGIMKHAQFPRDFWANRGDEKSLQHHLALNPLDAYAWNNLGKLQQKNGDKKSAITSYKNAILTNPANNFEFYVNYFRLASQLPTQSETQKITDTALKFLKTYPEKVASNIHYTANSGNFQEAIVLAGLLHQDTLAKKIRSAKKTYESQKVDTTASKE